MASLRGFGNRSEAEKSFDKHTPNILDAYEVETLLMKICETSITEFELKLKDFKLYVRRDANKMDLTSPPTNYTTLATGGKSESINFTIPVDPPASDSLESQTTSALPLNRQQSTQKPLDTFDDEGMYLVTSPKVGIFKRGRNRKGKTGPPLLKEGQTVKAGQVVCYVEQLGSQTPVESKVAGEVVSILRTNDEAVGYGDPLVSIRPSFPGIKKLN
ncbi:uncharacterized protein LOC131033018 isoform X2 [Cryptomeria japonica]|uniref:uncharacterized protein LOC131033018 isoform X2 n=1 Tax=Cryptomeria japonica TaxID=3369 RepID=UPI0025ACB1B6|nr:uncharacterized protein LOC131033018 isoform X2 [Cryptomeria japonica]